MEKLEHEVNDVLQRLITFEVEGDIVEIGPLFAKLLASLQKAQLIDFNLDILVETSQCLPQTKMLLESLLEAKRRSSRSRKLLTHRNILKIWLRKNKKFRVNYLPTTF